MTLIQCSYPRCEHSVSAPNMLAALEVAQRMGYTEDGTNGALYCRDHPPALSRPL